jgi:hypothetical protein
MRLPLATGRGTAPYASGSETSQAAAVAIQRHMKPQQVRLLRWLLTQERGATDQEMEDGLGWGGSTVRPRRGELEGMGLIYPHGKRLTRSGREAVVWHARPEAATVLEEMV